MEREQFEMMLNGGHFKCMIGRQLAEICLKYDLKKTETDVLVFLSKSKDANTGKDILEWLKINKGYLSQIMDSLCKKGYVEAVPDKNDRRYIHYELTDSAEDIIKEITEVHDRINAKLFSGLTESEIEAFKSVSEKIRLNIQDILKNGL